MSDIVVGLDIGTYVIRVVVAHTGEAGFEIAGMSEVPSVGLRAGVIVNIDATAEAIKEAIKKAEENSGYEIASCWTGIGGLNIDSKPSNGKVGVSASGKAYHEVTQKDIDRVIECAKTVRTNMDSKILHVITQYYEVDGARTRDPLGTQGYSLEVNVLIITGSSTQSQNILTCFNRAGLGVEKILLKTLAAAEAVANNEELEAGSIIIDLGGGTTDTIVFCDGAPICTCSLPLGGKDVTSDIAQWQGVSVGIAESIKIKYGCCFEDLIDNDMKVLFPGAGGKAPQEVSQKDLCRVMSARVEEILQMTRAAIVKKLGNHTKMNGSIILTGGGAMAPGIVELTQLVFRTSSVRLGIPAKLGGAEDFYRRADYASVVGLVMLGKKQSSPDIVKKLSRRAAPAKTSNSESVLSKMKKWLAL